MDWEDSLSFFKRKKNSRRRAIPSLAALVCGAVDHQSPRNGAAARLFKSPWAPARAFFARGKTTPPLVGSSKHVTAPRRGYPSGRGPSRGAKMLHRQFLLGAAFCCCLTERCGAPSPAVTRRYWLAPYSRLPPPFYHFFHIYPPFPTTPDPEISPQKTP